MEYNEFIRRKSELALETGFKISKDEINPFLKRHQPDAVMWALRGGRRALFESFGLGKTCQQLEILRIIGEREGGNQIVICPLGVRQEFVNDCEKMGYPETIRFIRRTEEIDGPGSYITNYESVREGKLDVNYFNAISLDEAGVLRSYGSKTYQTFLTLFNSIKYRFVATATPSPNRFKEIIHYAAFLGVMDSGQSLTRFFKRDSSKANNLTLYPHKEAEFWLWVSSWALFVQKPSDLGYSDEGYEMPELRMHYHRVISNSSPPVNRDGQMGMFPDASLSLKDAAKEKRESMDVRIEKAVDIITEGIDPGSQFIIWCDLDAEQKKIGKELKKLGISGTSLFGATKIDDREKMINQWKDGEKDAFVSKPTMYGCGINMQQCHDMIFLGVSFKFYDFLQSIHRIHRFKQDHECDVHVLYAHSEQRVLDVLLEKWEQHKEMVSKMTEIIKKYGLSRQAMADELKRSIGIERVEFSGDNWVFVNNDAVEECRLMESDSIGLIHTSVPFANHYEYTPSLLDFGHTKDNAHFWEQMDYLTPELFRVIQPGRIAAIHVKDRVLFGNVTGYGFPTCDNMLEETSLHFQKHGFKKMAIITIVTDVVRENNQTYRLGWSEQCKDGSKMGTGSPEYVILMRKPQTDKTKAYADVPVQKSKAEYSRSRWQIDAHAFWRDSGERLLNPDEIAGYPQDVIHRVFQSHSIGNLYDHEFHVVLGERLDAKGALPAKFMALNPASHNENVWHDINRMQTLNSEQARRNVQLHICPLQFGIVDRIIRRFSNEGEWVYDPFAGIGTVPLRAIKIGRKGIGTELNPDSFADAVRYLEITEHNMSIPTLFDFEKMEAAG